jgi:drug/metabolite transporter (DMT)-like permease
VELWQVAAALLSAMLHAGWNAAVKRSRHPREVMTAQMLTSAAIVLPGLFWTGLPPLGSWIWIAASTTINVFTVLALLRAYELAGFGAAYPVVRALSVLLVVPLAAAASGERMSLFGLAGVGLISAALLILAVGSPGGGALPRRALGWIAIAGVGTAGYVMCDAQGVRSAGSPWSYGCAVSITNGLAMSWLQGSLVRPKRLLVDHAGVAVPASIAAVVSYLLILWVWSGAPIAAGAALRDTSAIFAIVIAVLWLKEPFTKLRLVAMLLSAVAVPLLRFA